MTHEEFRAVRRRLGLSQGAMAEALGVHKNTVWRYEQPPGHKEHRVVRPSHTKLALILLAAKWARV